MIEAGQLYTKNGRDFRVHEIRKGQVYGVVYNTNDRNNLDPLKSDYAFRRIDIEEFEKTQAELVKE